MVDYAKKRIKDHIGRFTKLYYQIKENNIDEIFLKDISKKDRKYIMLIYNNITIEAHKEAMDKIIKDEYYSKAYRTTNKSDFKTIDEALNTYKLAVGN